MPELKEHERPWRPLSPEAVMAVLSPAAFPWWIAGGHAIEHFVGRPLRAHGDIDVLLLHVDHARARNLLADWDCWAADPPGALRPWQVDETLPSSVSDVWCRESRDDPWRFQLMFDEGEARNWRSRRCPVVTKPLAELGSRDAHGVPFIVAEIPLFYKSKAPRAKDELDFAAALPLLSDSQKAWLRAAITMAYGRQNTWLTARSF